MKNGNYYFISVIFMFVAATSNVVYANITATSDSNECATCHVMWISDFQDKSVETLIPYNPQPVELSGKQNGVASTERMCFSCHDGYILESRYRWREGRHNHPVGQKVPKKIKIPKKDGKETFPLNMDKKVYCGTCHSAHGVDWGQNRSAIFMRAVNESSNMCRACHKERATGSRHGNHPILNRIKRLPENLKQAGAKIGPQNKVVCESCHRQHGAPADKLLVLDNSQSSRLCVSCHKDKKSMSNTKHDMNIMSPDLKNSKKQTAVKNGLCSACHVSHDAKGPKLASIAAKQGADPLEANCVNCHNDSGVAKKAAIGRHSHPINVNVNKLGIKVTDKQWQSDSVLVEQIGQMVSLPLYDKKGHSVKGGTQVACGTCHDPHNWSVKEKHQNTESVSAERIRALRGNGNNSFLRIAQGMNSALCTNCHIDKLAIKATKHNPRNVTGEMAEMMHPKRQSESSEDLNDGLCGTCHKAHNGKSVNMWAREVNLEKGNVVIERLCNDCHNKESVAKGKLTGTHSHPLGITLQKMKGHNKLPLFNKEGERTKDKNGRIDCATCHNVHQWDPLDIETTAGAVNEVDGDATNSFLRIPSTATKEMCIECHTDEQYVAGTEHDLNISAPDAKNKFGQTVKQSGVCGQCHAVHNASTKTKLWARKLGKANDPIDLYCRSCHQKGEIAGSKVIPAERGTHPKDVLVWSSDIRDKAGRHHQGKKFNIPVFNRLAKHDNVGQITCASCHNPHKWNGRKKQKGPAKKTEGNANNSFLNVTNTENFVCSDCHGLDGLFRYKYFHSPSSRKKHRLYE